ncbi:MAG: hypothetical protein IPH04_15585 [Saprospirales bacterium]|jgi:hypothetical protein|nr:hypothetical protein [Saprospirales bacterium]MBK6904176.1 hypothetical protein [Saprospirales bacterium]
MQKFSLRFVHLFAVVIISFFGISLLSSCQTEGCTEPMSDNFDPKAKKNDGSCVPWRDKFAANYTGINACAGSADEGVSFVIAQSSTTEDGIVVSIPSEGMLFTAKVDSQNGITIAEQDISYQGSIISISGSGSLTGKTITISYSLTSGPLTVPCTLTGDQP